MKLKGLLLSAVTASAIAVPGRVVHEKRFAETGLHRGKRVEGTSITTFRVGLKQDNLEHGYDYLMGISHPDSLSYGKHWSPEQVRKTFAPSSAAIEAVRTWITSFGIENVTESHGWMSFEAVIGQGEQLFNTEYYEHEDHETGAIRIGCDQYHLPQHISQHVDFVTPGVALSPPLEKRLIVKRDTDSFGPGWRGPHGHHWPSPNPWRHPFPWPNPPGPPGPLPPPPPPAKNLPPGLRHCGFRISPECIKALYGLPSPQEVESSYDSSPINSLGLFEADGTYNESDMNQFFQKFAPYVPVGTEPIPAPINNAQIQQGKYHPFTNGETELDLQIMYPIIYPQTITLYQISPRHYEDTFDGFPLAIQDFLDAIDASFCNTEPPNQGNDCGIYVPKRVISMSYGVSELIQPEKYIHRLCNEFMKLGLQGTTFTISSGDYGVAAQPGFRLPEGELSNGCVVPGSYNKTVAGYRLHRPKGVNGTIFQGQFPATCPYILSVGATRLYPDQIVNDPESVMQLPHLTGFYDKADIEFSSGGGFSNYFPRPSYQSDAVNSYFSQHDPGYPYYNFNGVDFHNPNSNIGANGGIYNRAGRGFPDVSSNGAHVDVVYYGDVSWQAGTSCAAPTWGSIITLINEKRTQAGKGPVGFVNPVLYAHPEAFNDVTNGTNPGCFTRGFPAVSGWDPSTGLGTPNYPKLLEIFMSLP